MKLSDLTRYGIPESIVDAWQRRQGDYLLPLQERAIREGLLDIDNDDQVSNLLISAPTSSGKSFCGELAAIVSLLKRRKAIMLLPLKSIAEEKYNYFNKCYRDIGIKVIIATGDHPENDADLELGNFDMALAIYEKFNRLLTVNLDILQQIGLIVIDELQMIADPRRGYELEMALIKTLNSGYQPRLIALSAVIDDGAALADWMHCREVGETVRPVDLLQGVAVDGYFHFRSFNSGHEGREKIALSNDKDSLAENLIDYLKNDKSRKLIFLSSRRATIDAAFKLASSSGWPEAKETIGCLEGEENSFLIRSLKQTLSRGVAFHNADLTPTQRQAIENGYRCGEIRVIFSTTTLAMGVNLPAETVLLETMKYSSGDFSGKPSLVPISVSEFRNITGRAGRFGCGNDRCPGRAVVLAGSAFEFEVLWSEYIDTHKKEKLTSTLPGRNLSDIVLDLLACGFDADFDRLTATIQNSLHYRQNKKLNGDCFEGIMQELMTSGFINQHFRATPLGRVVAESGLTINSALNYMARLEEKYPQNLPGWLLVALSGGAFDIQRAGQTAMEHRGRMYERLLFQEFNEYVNEVNEYTDIRFGREPLDFKTSAILKATFLLTDWAGGLSVERLEQRYQLHHGQIINLAESAGWLLASLARLIYAGNCSSPVPAQLEEMAFNVQFGINPRMKEIHIICGRVLNRMDIKLLEDNGIKTPDDLQEIEQKQLAELIKPEGKLRDLLSKLKNLEQEDKMQTRMQNHGFDPRVLNNTAPTSVELDGTYDRERYLVNIDGFSVRLTGKSFKYLAKLAFSRLMNGDGWIYKDDLEVGFNQARYLYRLKQEFKRGGVSWPIFENNRLGYYRLDLDPSKIKLNLDNLKSHDDFELRQMAQEAGIRTVS